MNKPNRQLAIEHNQKRVHLIFKKSDTQSILEKVMEIPSETLLKMITDAGLRGRGGAGFPTGLKWKTVREQESKTKFIICNADEGEPGTFKDREILQKQAGKIIIGMTICAKVTGAKEGFIYLRSEYSYLEEALVDQINAFNKKLKKLNLDFSISLRYGSGAYICGEETALLESMEGKRGEPRNKPPYPATNGYLDQPTVINNVETFVYCTLIIEHGVNTFTSLGTLGSRGSKVLCISGDAAVKGIYELELGMTLKEFVELFGDEGTKAVQVGGAAGFCVPHKDFSTKIIAFEGVPTGGSMMLFSTIRSMYHVLINYLEFFVEESCGQCTPCRVGCQQLLNGLIAVKKGEKKAAYLDTLIDLAETMRTTAKCGLGQSVANPFISIVESFREEMIY